VTDPIDLDARVPCCLCGGAFRWIVYPYDGFIPASAWAKCDACGNEWTGPFAPVTWRTLATVGGEVEPAYVARLVEEVDRLRTRLDALLMEVVRPLWLPRVADAVGHGDEDNATPLEVLDAVRRVVDERDELRARVEQLAADKARGGAA